MSSAINDINLAFLDASDTIIEIVTYDSTTIHNTIAMADTFRSIGYPASKVRYLVNRADSPGGIDAGRPPAGARPRARSTSVVSDGQLVVRSNNEGVPFVLADPSAPVSQDIVRVAAELLGAARVAGRRRASLGRAVSDPRPIGVFDSGVGGLTVLREIIRRSPHESTIYLGDNARAPVRRPLRRRGPRASRPSRSTRSSSATSRRSSSPATPRPRSASAAFRRRYDLPVLGVIRPGRRGRGAGDAQPARRGHRDAGDDPLARLLRRDQGREPGRRGLRARDAGARAAGRGRRADRRRSPRRPSPMRWRRSSASATRDGESIFPRPPGATIDTLLLGCTHYPLLRPIIAARRRGAGRDRRLGDGDGVGAGRAARA